MISFNGFNETILTFKAAASIDSGKPVKVSANETVALCADGNTFAGISRGYRDGAVGVQLSGYVELPYSGTAPALGLTAVCANGDGGIQAGNGRSVLVVKVDTDNTVCGFIF